MHPDLAITAASFTRGQKWKPLKRPLTDGWINTVERYSVLKRKENLTQATEWMKLEYISLGKMSDIKR